IATSLTPLNPLNMISAGTCPARSYKVLLTIHRTLLTFPVLRVQLSYVPLKSVMRLPGSVLSITLLAGLAFGRAQSNFDPDSNTWTLSNSLIRASFQLTAEGFFLTRKISDLQSGDPWTASSNRPASLVRLQVDNDLFDAQTKYFLITHFAQSVNPGG